MTPAEKTAEIYRKLHETRFEHVEQARRARDTQAELVVVTQCLLAMENATEREKAAFWDSFNGLFRT